MRVILFEDAGVDQLEPITLSRPAYTITCGGWRLIDLVQTISPNVSGLVRPHLRPIQEDYGVTSPAHTEGGPPWLLVNARLVPSLDTQRRLQNLANQTGSMAVQHDGRLGAVVLASERETKLSGQNVERLTQWAEEHIRSAGVRVDATPLPEFSWPHDVLRYHAELLPSFLEHRTSAGLYRHRYRQLADGVFVGANTEVSEQVLMDTRGGPILIEDGARIGPFTVLKGPAQIGPEAQVLPQSRINGSVSLGHMTKIGGEITSCIVEPFTNKQHYGFLGHSYVGSWVNLGAGTNTSNLKNTYGEIAMRYGEERVGTGSQCMGAVIGDYAKSAINTSIFTGKTIGSCSTLYGVVTENVPPFVNHARSLGSVTEMSIEAAWKMQSRMFDRREVTQRDRDRDLIRRMFELTGPQRTGLPKGPPKF